MKMEILAINLINQLQTKVETLAGMFEGEDKTSHMNEHAFNELCIHNVKLHNSIKAQFTMMERENQNLKQQIEQLKSGFTQLTTSQWFCKNNPDIEYQSRQCVTREQKINNPRYKECGCGEWLSKSFFTEHQKRDKCVSSHMRIKFNKGDIKVRNIDSLLLINAKINRLNYVNHKYNPYGMYCLQLLMKKKYFNTR